MNGDDSLDEFMEYDFAMGADMVKCPHCGENLRNAKTKARIKMQ